VPEVVTTGCGQRCLQRDRPLFIGVGEVPHSAGRQIEVSERSLERVPGVDRLQESLPYFNG
jgi:hypothetical protein